MIEYFDSHTHVQFAAYDGEREELIQKTLSEGVGFVNVGTNKRTSQDAVRLAKDYENEPIYATVGLHPIHTYETGYHDEHESKAGVEVERFDYDFYKSLALEDEVVAVGECGLDYFRIDEGDEDIKEKQRKAFKEQVKLSKEAGKPLMIHCRPSGKTDDAYEDLYEILSKEEDLGDVIMHFYAGSKEMAEKFIDLGFYFTFGGVITFTRDYDEQVKAVPDDKLLLETDAPYVAPKSHRRERNEPRYVKEMYEKVSRLRDIPMEELQEKIIENNERVFGIDI